MEDGQQTNIINILTLMNSRKLLSFMYVLKSVMLLLKNYMSTHIQTIINVIIAMIRVLFEDTPEKEHQ